MDVHMALVAVLYRFVRHRTEASFPESSSCTRIRALIACSEPEPCTALEFQTILGCLGMRVGADFALTRNWSKLQLILCLDEIWSIIQTRANLKLTNSGDRKRIRCLFRESYKGGLIFALFRPRTAVGLAAIKTSRQWSSDWVFPCDRILILLFFYCSTMECLAENCHCYLQFHFFYVYSWSRTGREVNFEYTCVEVAVCKGREKERELSL